MMLGFILQPNLQNSPTPLLPNPYSLIKMLGFILQPNLQNSPTPLLPTPYSLLPNQKEKGVAETEK